MGQTSLLMFPIYGCGAFLAPIGMMIDRWVNPRSGLAAARTDIAIRHGFLYMVLIFVAEYFSEHFYGAGESAHGIIPAGAAPTLTA